ncbi:hypothetical protein SAMN04487911_10863 [Arenibacter nanhaiticus]|uniref:Uncharacterized protein n=1 Tax=Arenibacter nanhaiticus TaxID=558155 RepID=A0A1M6FBE9_9FLAO|nr:hypothetical protein SAMN04487911_10863 [Arenibacter nanhaiticus]
MDTLVMVQGFVLYNLWTCNNKMDDHQGLAHTFLYNPALGTAAASPQQRKGYSQGPARGRRERPKGYIKN